MNFYKRSAALSQGGARFWSHEGALAVEKKAKNGKFLGESWKGIELVQNCLSFPDSPSASIPFLRVDHSLVFDLF